MSESLLMIFEIRNKYLKKTRNFSKLPTLGESRKDNIYYKKQKIIKK